MTDDLFGQRPRRRRPAYEAALERLDRETLSERAARVRWVSRNIPRGGMLLPADSLFVFTETRSAFVEGLFIATVVLAAGFAEHWMTGILTSRGFARDCKGGLRACISCAKAHEIWPEIILGRLAHLQSIRNPFVHLKDFEDTHTLAQRSWRRGRAPEDVLEQDAKEALESIFALVKMTAVPAFFSPNRR